MDLLVSAARTSLQRGRTDAARIEAACALVCGRFTSYSVLHPWEGPAVAFRRGRGFCLQYNGALLHVLRAMGYECSLVGARRVRMEAHPEWRLGHAWVRVRLGPASYDVCAGSPGYRLGSVPFVPLAPVRPLTPAAAVAATAASAAAAYGAVLRAAVLGKDRPGWVEHPRPASSPTT